MASLEMRRERLYVYAVDTVNHQDSFARDVAHGLSAAQKFLPAKYFYDERGSRLYEQICDLPEYYLYRAEREILASYATEIHAEIGHLSLVELGPGNASKMRYLLAEYERAGKPFVYCPVDIAHSMLLATAKRLLAEYAHISIQALHADFANHPDALQTLQIGHKAVAFLGSSLGNFTPEERDAFLQHTVEIMEPEDVFLLGVDLKKPSTILLPAYNDALGITAAFNMNILHRINRELGGNFDLEAFEHLAIYNEKHGRIEMHLRSRREQQVTIAETAQTVTFTSGETIHTENSCKYSVEEMRDMGQRANLALHRTWFDRQRYFLLALFRPVS